MNILSPLWSFLVDLKRPDPNAPINNSVTDGSPSAIQNASIFFSRLNIYLLGKMQSTMLVFLQERVPGAMQLLVKNLDLQPITELLYRFYALPAITATAFASTSSSSLTSSRSSTPILGNNFDIFTWLEESNLYAHLAEQFKPSAGQEAHESTAQFITGLFNLPFPDSSIKGRCLEPFLQASWLHALLEAVFDGEEGDEESSLTAALQVIGTIFKSIQEVKAEELAAQFLRAFAETADTFFDLLTQRNSVKYILLPCGRVNALGAVRLAAVEMFIECVTLLAENSLSDALHEQLLHMFSRHRFSQWMLEAFFSQFPQNSFLQAAFLKYVRVLCLRQDCLEALLKPIEEDLRHAIVRAQRENDSLQVQPRQNRLPFMGHLIAIAEELCALDESRVSGAGFTVRDSQWHEFATKSLKEAQQRNSQVLGGIRPPIAPSELSSSDAEGPALSFFSSSGGGGSGDGNGFLDYNAVFGSGDEEQLARYFVQQIIGNVPHQFLYDEYQRRFSNDSNDSDDDEEDEDKDSDDGEEAKGIEIPLLLGHGDFDEMMFEASFADSMDEDSDSMDDEMTSDESGHDSDNDSDDDFEDDQMHE